MGYLYAWWRGDPLPDLAELPGFSASEETEARLVAAVSGLDTSTVVARLEHGHRAYVAHVGDRVVAYGWSATREAGIGELGIGFSVPPGNRYLWDFVTLPGSRGRGIYPRLLRAILRAEASEAERFWIGHDVENAPSERGILRAGFRRVGEVALLPGGGIGLVPVGPGGRTVAGARLFGVPVVERA